MVNKSFKIAKMNINDMVKPIIIFYLIIIAVVTFTTIQNITNFNDNFHIVNSGLELATVIFLFVCGLNSFKENFYFAKSNNISRKSFIIGVIESIFPIAVVMAVIDVMINRITNIFVQMPTIYDILYTSTGADRVGIYNEWIQGNSFLTIINTFLLLLALYCFAYVLGVVINMIYFRCNTIMKVVVSIIPIALLNIAGVIELNNRYFFPSVYEGIRKVFGIATNNVYLAFLSLILIVMVLTGISFLLIKKAEVKGK